MTISNFRGRAYIVYSLFSGGDLPHPRHFMLKTTPAFAALKVRRTDDIRAESIPAAAAAS
jgi:hypothetical protein